MGGWTDVFELGWVDLCRLAGSVAFVSSLPSMVNACLDKTFEKLPQRQDN